MLKYAFLAALAASGWQGDVSLQPPAKDTLVLVGSGAPADVALIGPQLPTVLTLKGPGTVTVQLYGVFEARGRPQPKPGRITIRTDAGSSQAVALPSQPESGWSVGKHPRWAVSVAEPVTLTLDAGEHTLVLTPSGRMPFGFGLRLEIVAAPPLVAAVPEPPALPAAPEPATVAAAPAAPSDKTLPSTAGLTLLNDLPLTKLVGPAGAEEFYQVSLERAMAVDAVGPGLIFFDIHAHRAEQVAESLKPVIVALFLDEVLAQTVAIDRPASPDYRVEDGKYVPSVRTTLALPLSPGTHHIRLALSDSAVLGASIRPRFERAPSVVEPELLSADAARKSDLKPPAPRTEVQGNLSIGVLAAGWLPANVAVPSVMAQLEVVAAIPVAGRRLALGLSAGAARGQGTLVYRDGRTDTGTSRLGLMLDTAPLVADLRLLLPLSESLGLEVGLGGGALLVRTEGRSRKARAQGDLVATPAGFAHLTGLAAFGPGKLMLRLALIGAGPVTSGMLRNFSPGGALIALGYRLS